MRIPKDFNVFIHADGSVHIILNNYDGNILAFQIIVLGVPLLVGSVILAINLNAYCFLTLLLLLLVIYWCFYNYYDRTKFIFNKDYFVVLEGMHEFEKLKIEPHQVLRTEKRRKSGKEFSSAKSGNTTITSPVYQLYIHTQHEELLVTEHVGPNGQVYLEEAINSWLQKTKGKE
jgi:hypothetical protein